MDELIDAFQQCGEYGRPAEYTVRGSGSFVKVFKCTHFGPNLVRYGLAGSKGSLPERVNSPRFGRNTEVNTGAALRHDKLLASVVIDCPLAIKVKVSL